MDRDSGLLPDHISWLAVTSGISKASVIFISAFKYKDGGIMEGSQIWKAFV